MVDVIGTATHPLRIFMYALNSVLGDNPTTGIVVCDFGASSSVLQITGKKLRRIDELALSSREPYCNREWLVSQFVQHNLFKKKISVINRPLVYTITYY